MMEASQPVNDQSRWDGIIPRIYPLFGLILFGLTWRLWTPQQLFPQVSLISLQFSFPGWLEWVCFAGVLLGLLGQLLSWSVKVTRVASLVFLSSLCLLFIDDTHRLQPWAWHLFLLTTFWQVSPARDRVKFIIWLTASIYIFSAISKLDVNFVNGVGSYLLDGLFNALQIPPDSISEQSRNTIVWSFPAGELMAGLGMLWRRTFRWAIILSLMMHATLLLTLGPLGLKHHWPVLVWNLLFITQNLLLWTHRGCPNVSEEKAPVVLSRRGLRRSVCFLLLALPVLNVVSLWPHWLSWGLYSERISDVFIYVSDEARGRLPVALHRYSPKSDLDGNLSRLRTDRMSLGELNAPEFPQERFQIGVAVALARQYDLKDGILVVIKSPPDRRTGWRDSREFAGRPDLEKLAAENRL